MIKFLIYEVSVLHMYVATLVLSSISNLKIDMVFQADIAVHAIAVL